MATQPRGRSHAAATQPAPPLQPQVAREEQFAAVKNAPGSATDSPDTARAALLAQGARWVAAAGGAIAPSCVGVEVSPLVSYAGEGLQQRVQGTTLQGPVAYLS
jgi:UDP-N-acetylglucosamine/UDP-N-acetylgalactosamine diphosphorylase